MLSVANVMREPAEYDRRAAQGALMIIYRFYIADISATQIHDLKEDPAQRTVEFKMPHISSIPVN